MLNRNDIYSIIKRILKYFVFLTVIFMFKQCTVKADMVIDDENSIRIHTYTNQTTNTYSNFCITPGRTYNNNVFNYTYDIGNNGVIQLDLAPNGQHYNSNCSNNDWEWPDYNSLYFYITTPNFFSNVSSSLASCHIYNVNSYLDSDVSNNTYQNPYNKNILVYCDNISLSEWHYGVKVNLYVTKNGSNLPNSNTFTFTRPVFLDSIENRTFKQQVETNEKLGNIIEQQQQTNDFMNSTDMTAADNEIDGFLQGGLSNLFKIDDSLQQIVNLPVQLFNSLTSVCTPIQLNIPFINETATIPCPDTIYNKILGSALKNILKIVINGFICYRLLIVILGLVQNMTNPDDSKLEVVDL